MKKICFVATIPAVVNSFLRDHIQAAAEKYEVTVVCSDEDKYLLSGLNARVIFTPIKRKPSPWQDLRTVFELAKLFHQEKFEIVHTHMPKTALLGMLAAWLTCVPIRINTFHGEVWATRSGLVRTLFKSLDRLIVSLATHILVVSPSQRDFLIKEGVLTPGKANLIGSGSICGVDSLRFKPDTNAKESIREDLGISQDAIVILFVGRLNRDKGMLDLAEAFSYISNQQGNVDLLLVGAEEDVPFVQIKDICSNHSARLHYVKFTKKPEAYMAAADIFCLPSYREGLPMTTLEAAACCVPSVASRIYGITDAVIEGETGVLFTAGDIEGLTKALLKLIEDYSLRQELGLKARLRVIDQFQSQKITNAMMMFYNQLLKGY